MVKVVWFITKIILTLAGIFTLQHVIESNGYRIPIQHTLLAGLLVVIVIRLWAPNSDKI